MNDDTTNKFSQNFDKVGGGERGESSLVQKVTGIINACKNYRALFEPKWYVNYNAYENNHFTVWLPESREVKQIPIRGNKFFNQIPEIQKQVDTLENMILSTEIVPIVYPVKMDDVSTYWAEKISDYCMYLYKHWFFNGVLHDGVHDALVQPVSYFQLLPPQTNDGKMDILELDAFNVYHAPGIKDVQSPECRYIGKDWRTPIEEIHNNKNYDAKNRKKVRGTANWSTSLYKDMLFSERYSQAGTDEKKAKTAIVNELWVMENQKSGNPKVRVITECEGMLLRNELTPYDRLPFVSLKLHQGVLYQPSFVETKLPINRTIDLMQSRMEDMALKMVRGQMLAQYGSNITRQTDVNGDIIYWKLSKPENLDMPVIPDWFPNFLNQQYQLMERYGASGISMGTSQKGAKAYRTVEAIRQQDMASIKTSMDFMKIALTQLFNLVIYFASMYYLEPVNVKIYEQEDYNVFDVLGEKGLPYNMNLFANAGGDKTKAPTVISSDNVVEVEFETASSYTMEGKKQTVFQALAAGVIDKEAAIRMLHFGNTRDIMKALDEEQQQKMQQQTVQAALTQAANGIARKPEGKPTAQPAGQPSGSSTPPMPGPQPTNPMNVPGIHVGQ